MFDPPWEGLNFLFVRLFILFFAAKLQKLKYRYLKSLNFSSYLRYVWAALLKAFTSETRRASKDSLHFLYIQLKKIGKYSIFYSVVTKLIGVPTS